MKFKVKRTSDFFIYRKIEEPPKDCTKENDYFILETDSIEELIKICNNLGEVIILPQKENGLPVLEIYDDYRE